KALQASYKLLDQAVKNAVGESYYRDSAAQIRNLQQQQQALIASQQAERGKKKADGGKIDEYSSQIADITVQIQDLQREIQQNLLQTNFKDFSNQLADALSEAFAAGEDGTKALDLSFDKMIQNMIKNALKLKFLQGPVNDVLNSLADYMQTHGNDVTGFDFEAAKKLLAEKGKQFTDALAGFGDLFKNTVDPTSGGNSLAGAFKTASQESIDLLAGQTGGMRLAQLQTNSILSSHTPILMQQLEIASQGVKQLQAIANNTLRTADNTDKLDRIDNNINNIVGKIDSAANALRAGGVKGP
ncbi:MAG: hypothetical protein H7096_04955, partial [Flavobacterium sp.]|nr:hypothetical protein [Pedobacter sp.]